MYPHWEKSSTFCTGSHTSAQSVKLLQRASHKPQSCISGCFFTSSFPHNASTYRKSCQDLAGRFLDQLALDLRFPIWRIKGIHLGSWQLKTLWYLMWLRDEESGLGNPEDLTNQFLVMLMSLRMYTSGVKLLDPNSSPTTSHWWP